MEMVLLASLSILWGATLINLALTSRILRWIRAANEAKTAQQGRAKERRELVIGTPAPDFKARTLAGQAVRLDDYSGRAVAFLFVSPACGHCRLEMPMFVKLAPLAKKNADVEIILVSDWGPVATQKWLDTLHDEDGVDVPLPLLVAPLEKTDFLLDYNPGLRTPSFCLLNAQGNVQARGHLLSSEWRELKRTWEGVTRLSPFMFNRSR